MAAAGAVPPGPPAGERLLIAADPAGGRFDGRIESPAILDAAGSVVAAWDFAVGIETDRIEGTHPGRLVNMPTRGIRGSRWTGTEMHWRHAPQDYAAIHFHADDLYDAGWDTDFVVTIPEGMRSAASTACGCDRGPTRTSSPSSCCRPAER